MKYLYILIAIVFAACSSSKNSSTTSNPLNGTWLPIKEEIGGKELPPAAFSTQKLVMSDSNYTFTAESVDKGVVRCEAGKMDIYGKEGVNAGKHFTAIYKMENDQLIICYNLAGTSYPSAFETKSNPVLFLCTFKKQ